jgi:hypothetical protein
VLPTRSLLARSPGSRATERSTLRPHFAVYITPELRDGGTPCWVLLDVWLSYPIWKGGSIALLALACGPCQVRGGRT